MSDRRRRCSRLESPQPRYRLDDGGTRAEISGDLHESELRWGLLA